MSSLKDFWFKFKAEKINRLKKKQATKLLQYQTYDQKLVHKLTAKKKIPNFKQLTHLKQFLSDGEKMLMRILGSIVLIALVSLCINIYWTHSELGPKDGGSYTEGLVGSPKYVNPLFAGANDVDLDISSLIFSGLIKYAEQSLQNDLADSWTLSEDQRIYTFHIKQNVYWHDGEKLDADDVEFTFSRIKNPKTKTPLYFTFKDIQVTKLDEYTVEFILEEPFAPFLESLTVGILPEHIWSNIEPENMMITEYNLKPIGSGPYQFVSLTKSKNGEIKKLNLKSNQGFYNQVPYVKEIIFKFFENFDSAVAALNNKNIEGLSYLPKELQPRVINNRNLNFHLLHLPQYTALFFNGDNNRLLQDVDMRETLSNATNKEKIVSEILRSEAQTTNSCILPGSLGYNPDITDFPFNPDLAKSDLENAGWKLTDYVIETEEENDSEESTEEDENLEQNNSVTEQAEQYPFQVRKKKEVYLEFSLTTVDQPENVQIAKEVQKEWQQIGAKLNLHIVSAEEIQQVIKNRDYEILLYSQILGHDPDPFPFWHSEQRDYPGLNLTSVKNTEIDELLEDARRLSDPEARAEKYSLFQELLAQEVPAIFLFNPTYTYPQSKKIKGFETTQIITPANRLSNINNWYIKTSRNWE